MENNESSVKTDVALLKNDMKQFEKSIIKLDSVVDELFTSIKTLAVQEKILENNEKRINSLEESIKLHTQQEETFRNEFNRKFEEMKEAEQKERERRHRELLDSIEKLNKNMSEKIEKQNERISSLENWRWYILGIGAVVVFLLNKLPWALLFG